MKRKWLFGKLVMLSVMIVVFGFGRLVIVMLVLCVVWIR